MSRLFYVLSGQHKYSAAVELADRMVLERVEVPAYLTKFRCHIIKADTPLELRQKIAGREQARQDTVKRQSLSDTIQWFLKEVEMFTQRAVQNNEPVIISKRELLKLTYQKTGKSFNADGTPV